MKNWRNNESRSINGCQRIDSSTIKDKIDPLIFYEFEGQVISNCKGLWKKAGLCPFHLDRRAGSFYIHSETGAFKCFSCEAKGGDIISFLMKKYEMTFKEAIQTLSSFGGISC